MTDAKRAEQHAYRDGYRSDLHGATSQNPWPVGSPKYEAWNAGRYEAELRTHAEKPKVVVETEAEFVALVEKLRETT